MSQLSAFIEAVQHNEQVKARLREAQTTDDLIERARAEAEAHGYVVTADEVRQHLKTQQKLQELSDQELEAVTGGTASALDVCITDIWPC